MKVLMLLETDFPNDIRVENETEILLKNGYSVDIICLTRDVNRVKNETINGVSVFRKHISSFYYKSKVGQLKFPFYNSYWKKIVSSHLSENKHSYDCIHVHDLSMLSIGLWFKNKLNLPLVTDLHENFPYLIKDAKHTERGIGKWLSDYRKWIEFEKTNIKKSDYVITVVKEMQERMQKFDDRKNKYFIYQNVIRKEEIEEYKELEYQNFTMVYAGGLTPPRGVQNVLKAIQILKSKSIQFKFVICGTGNYYDDLKQLTAELGIENYVEFKGQVSQKDVYKIINDSNATIIPHLRSVQNDCSSPNKLYQYMAFGRPIICSDCKSLERVISDTNCGLIYQDTDYKELADKIEFLINSPAESKILGYNGWNAVNNSYNSVIEGENIVSLYKQIENDLAR